MEKQSSKSASHVPEVTIGMPVYNGSKYIRRAMDSLLSQTFEDFELIISDNASDDNTLEILKEYTAKDKRIILHRQNINIGAIGNFRFVLSQAKGKYFMWAACDDWWNSQFILSLKTALDRHPDYGVAMSSLVRVKEDGSFYDEIIYTQKDDPTMLGYKALFRRMLKIDTGNSLHFFIYGLFRTKLLKQIMQRPFPNCMASDRVVMSEIALVARYFAIHEILHQRTIYDTEIVDRYQGDEIGRLWKDDKKFTRYIVKMVTHLMTSPAITVARKLSITPLLLVFFYRKIGLVAEELFHRK